MGKLRDWIVRRFEILYERVLTERANKPTYIGDSILLYYDDIGNGTFQYFLTATSKKVNVAVAVDQKIIRKMIIDLNEEMGLNFIEFEEKEKKEDFI